MHYEDFGVKNYLWKDSPFKEVQLSSLKDNSNMPRIDQIPQF